MGADVVKIATMAHGPHDNIRLLRLMRNARIPTVAFCMGEYGQPSRVLAARCGAPFSYATFHAERTMAPGQLSYQQMQEVYRYEKINGDTDVYAVIADPVAHSLSPQIHNAAFDKLGLNKVYLPFRVPPEELEQFFSDCREFGIRGLSVTIPHKEEVLHYKAKCDPATQEIGACNTLVWNDDQWIAYNTDYKAAMNSLDTVFGGGEGSSGLKGRTALVLGAGGVARAITHGLHRREADIVIASRTPQRADDLATFAKGRSIAWGLRSSVKADLIVNCTPLGMHPNLDDTPLEAKYIHRHQVIFDTVYNPENTLFIKQARELGCEVITGIDMFVGQAALQFKHFTDKPAPVETMRDVIRRVISAVKY
jgi:3-dehydroquinate dehydratase/shikimate dehydrogenase